MYKQILHTPEGVRDIYNGECRRKQFIQDQLHQVLLSMDMRIFRHRHLNFSMYSAVRSVRYRPESYTSSSTGKEIRLCFGLM